PVSVRVDTFGTGTIPDRQIEKLVREIFPLSPRGIIDYLDLRRPIYRKTAAYGHFGRGEEEGFTWEHVRRAGELRAAAGLGAEATAAV
ncbi:MAG TPA: methionine adenosyltransferase domain-containing protein, partial [Thermoanaerobaculia bacterium]|nr:methionine adenosyltransferase domain-containing protein [Thermoanaerobaculia bacterium]